MTKLLDGYVEPKQPPWPPDNSHVSNKPPAKLSDCVVKPAVVYWSPDDNTFGANTTTNPLYDPQAYILLNKPRGKV